MSKLKFSLNESLWIYSESIYHVTRNARWEIDALKPRGARVFGLKSYADKDGLTQLRHLLRNSDAHAILTRLYPRELMALQPLLRERKNFSVIFDDWWIMPHWFAREAEYVIFRKYNGLAVRLKKSGFLPAGSPPLLYRYPPGISTYPGIASLLRLPMLAVSPLVSVVNYFRRQSEPVNPQRYLYFPFAVSKDDLPLKNERIQFDFANTAGIHGIWLMRDPFAPFRHTFANLYHDRQRLVELIEEWEGKPFTFYDEIRDGRGRSSWDKYLEKTCQSRFVVATGGLLDMAVPKFIEYACLGTPMLGRGLPFEFPWLDECLFPVDIMQLTAESLKPLLHQALDSYPTLRDNCLKWRNRLLELYDPNNLLDMLQVQIDGKSVPPGYLKPAATQEHL